MKILFIVFGVSLLLYLLVPGPRGISDFEPLPNSSKSNLSGDTIQVPNVSAYYSNYYRDFATRFYYDNFKDNTMLPFGPVRVNHPPEFAYRYIKDQTQSTYLEEYAYPLRDTIFVNGLEPFDTQGNSRYSGATPFAQDGQEFSTKVTLRYYPSPIGIRVIVWMGIMLVIYAMWKIEVRGR